MIATLHGERAIEVAEALGMLVQARLTSDEARTLRLAPDRVSLELALPPDADHWQTDQIVSMVRRQGPGFAGIELKINLEPEPDRGQN